MYSGEFPRTMTTKVPALAAPAAKAPLAPVTIERRDPGVHDVAIEILYCGICHSDLHKVRDDWSNTHFPIVPGHEIVGRVVSVGGEVSRFRSEEIVGVGCLVGSCLDCAECRAGHEMFCERGATFTFGSLDPRQGSWTEGGYSTRIVVDEHFVVRIPPSLDLARAAPLLCGGITTYSPLRKFGCRPGERVAVVGLGGLGHLAVRFASAMGADVTVVSSNPDKAADAARFGAKRFVSPKEQGALEALRGQFGIVLDTVSAPHDLEELAGLLGNFGTLVLVGLPPTATPVDATGLVHGNKSVAGSNIGGLAETQEMLDYSGAHGIVAEVERISTDQVNAAYDRLQKGDARYRFVIDAATFRH
jgi:alcohol dehydrogenase (NADP+)